MKMIRTLLAVAAFLAPGLAHAQTFEQFNTYVLGLPAASTVNPNDVFYLNQGGVSKAVTGTIVAATATLPTVGAGQILANYTSSVARPAASNWMSAANGCPASALSPYQLTMDATSAPTNTLLTIYDGSQCVPILSLNSVSHALTYAFFSTPNTWSALQTYTAGIASVPGSPATVTSNPGTSNWFFGSTIYGGNTAFINTIFPGFLLPGVSGITIAAPFGAVAGLFTAQCSQNPGGSFGYTSCGGALQIAIYADTVPCPGTGCANQKGIIGQYTQMNLLTTSDPVALGGGRIYGAEMGEFSVISEWGYVSGVDSYNYNATGTVLGFRIDCGAGTSLSDCGGYAFEVVPNNSRFTGGLMCGLNALVAVAGFAPCVGMTVGQSLQWSFGSFGTSGTVGALISSEVTSGSAVQELVFTNTGLNYAFNGALSIQLSSNNVNLFVGANLVSVMPQSTISGTIALNLPTVSGTIPYGASSPITLSAAGLLACATCLTNTPAALTRTNDTNVTITLGGTPATALLQAASLTMGWAGQLGPSRGGTGLDTSASSGIPQVAAGTWSVSTTLPSGLSAPSFTVTTAFTATGLVTNADHANMSANTVKGNATSGSAAPTDLAVGSCSTAASAVLWTTNTGFGCNTSIAAAAVPASGITGLGSGVATALAANVVGSGNIVLAASGTTLPAGVITSSITTLGAQVGINAAPAASVGLTIQGPGSTAADFGLVVRNSTGSAGNSFLVDDAGNVFVPLITTDAATTDVTVCRVTSTKVLATGSGTLGICLGTSGEQFKTAFGPMDIGLNEIAAINYQTYRYLPGHGDSGARLMRGPTAQGVEAVIPDIVGHDPSGETINYDVGALLMGGLQALKQIKLSCEAPSAANDNFCMELLRRTK